MVELVFKHCSGAARAWTTHSTRLAPSLSATRLDEPRTSHLRHIYLTATTSHITFCFLCSSWKTWRLWGSAHRTPCPA